MCGPHGYDGAKALVGRKRVALVDAEGHVLALAVVPAIRVDGRPRLDQSGQQLLRLLRRQLGGVVWRLAVAQPASPSAL